MSCRSISALSDPRLEPYRQLKQSNLTRWSGRFIAEGRLVVERLLVSRFAVDSVLLSDQRLHLLDELAIPAETPLLVVSQKLAGELAGFHFHSGVLACGLRGEPLSIADVLRSSERETNADSPTSLLVACPRITDPGNLGSLLRLCRAFGVAGLLLGPDCCDPFSRRTLRVSMGNAFALPIVESRDLAADLRTLHDTAGYTLSATVLAADATPLAAARPAEREVLLLGNEAQGLDPEWIARCDRRLTIPMSRGADSLNVAVAAGIFLHWLRFADSGMGCVNSSNSGGE